MAGQMGNVKCTSSDLVVVKVLDDKDVVLVKGAVPGPANGVVLIKGSVKDVKKYVVPRAIKEVESKNPMKASKKGAPQRPHKPRQEVTRRGGTRRASVAASKLRDPRHRHDASSRRRAAGLRRALGLQARGDRPAAAAAAARAPRARPRLPPGLVAAVRASRWWARTARWSGSTATRCRSRSPGARVLRRRHLHRPPTPSCSATWRPSTSCSRTWRPTPPASARRTRRARRRCSRRR